MKRKYPLFFELRNVQGSSGSVFTALLAGAALISVLTYSIYQTMTGPVATMSRVVQKDRVDTQMLILSRSIIVAAANDVPDGNGDNGDCDADGHVEPAEYVTATANAPVGGGWVPSDIGVPQWDPWGSEYGYCVWDVGAENTPSSATGTCSASANRLMGSNDLSSGIAESQTVLAVISAGPDRAFQTTCSAFTNTSTDVMSVTSGSDDLIIRYSYDEASQAVSGLWTLVTGTPTAAETSKSTLEVGDIEDYNNTSGVINALSFSTTGLVDAGGGVQLADESAFTDPASCDTAGEAGSLRYNDSSTPAVQYCDGSAWATITGSGGGGGGGTADEIDALTDGYTEYPTDGNLALGENAMQGGSVTGDGNTAIGSQSLASVTTGEFNFAAGHEALTALTTSNYNLGVGYQAGRNIGNAVGNSAIGSNALDSLTTGDYNTAIGTSALSSAVSANNSTALGYQAMLSVGNYTENLAIGTQANRVSQGSENLAIGYQAMYNIPTADGNTAVGYRALYGDGYELDGQVAVGSYALEQLSQFAGSNVAIGYESQRIATSAVWNTSVGAYALYGPVGGDDNVSIGYQSLRNNSLSRNTVVGSEAMREHEGQYAAVIGAYACQMCVTGDHITAVGAFSMQNANSAAVSPSYGQRNTAFGYQTLMNSYASDNTAFGYEALEMSTVGAHNTAIGYQALKNITTGTGNTAAGHSAMSLNQTSSNNTAAGYQALIAVGAFGSVGERNTAAGYQVLPNITGGDDNTGAGYQALYNNSGSGNTAVGYQALYGGSYHSSNYSTAAGYQALTANTASETTAFGYRALASNGAGTGNTAAGAQAMEDNATGSNNTVVGSQALMNTTASNANTVAGANALQNHNVSSGSLTVLGANAMQAVTNPNTNGTAIGANAMNSTTGIGNTSLGYNALYTNAGGLYNVAVGKDALYDNSAGDYNTAIGARAAENITGDGNTAIGHLALSFTTTGSNNTGVGYQSVVYNGGNSNSSVIGYSTSTFSANLIRLGNGGITSLGGDVAYTGTSDRRLKKDIKPSDLGLDFIKLLRPVSFLRRNGNERMNYGFIAQEVESALAGRVTAMVTQRKDPEKTYMLRTNDILSPLVKSIQEQDARAQSIDRDLLSLEAFAHSLVLQSRGGAQ